MPAKRYECPSMLIKGSNFTFSVPKKFPVRLFGSRSQIAKRVVTKIYTPMQRVSFILPMNNTWQILTHKEVKEQW